MLKSAVEPVSAELAALDPQQGDFAVRFADALLAAAVERRASDIHLVPIAAGLELRWRVDGVLLPIGQFPSGAPSDVVTRLKVLADLLTYRNDTPQEGRLRSRDDSVEMRLSTFPTLHGEKAVVRLFHRHSALDSLDDLRLPLEIRSGLERLLTESSGLVLVTGPAGSGKTTTLYSCLRHLAAKTQGQRSLVSIEDPIESIVPGVAQSQVQPAVGFDFSAALRSVLRQDPEVILLGEIRDVPTAQVALQASLTGQLVLSSFHAGSAAGAISRLSDMGIEPYVLKSGLLAVVSQRLVRRLCSCRRPAQSSAEMLGLSARQAHVPVGCKNCRSTGYSGRLLIAEMLVARAEPVASLIVARFDTATIERAALAAGMVGCWQRALEAVEAGATSPAEVRRVLGFGGQTAQAASD